MKDHHDDIPVGPPARRLLEERVGEALERGSELAFLHVAGLDANAVVQRIAPLALVTRLGAAEEFAVLLEGDVVADDVLRALDVPEATVAIGVAPSVEGMTTGQLLGAADQALREARRRASEAAQAAGAESAEEARATVRARRFARTPALARVPRPLR